MKTVITVFEQVDDLLSVVGTLFLISQTGWQIHCYFAVDSPFSIANIQEELGAQVHFFCIEKGNLETVVINLQPDLIITHPDHSHIRNQESISIAVTKLALQHKIALWYASPQAFLRNFEPNFFVDINAAIQQKISTAQTFLNLDTVLVLARFWARELGYGGGYFEAFYLARHAIEPSYFANQLNQLNPLVVSIHAHGDDEVLPCAGTLFLMSQVGWRVHCVVLTDGNHSSSPIKGLRQQEAIAAGKLIGATYEFHSLEECAFTAQEVIKLTERVIAQHQPSLIITHAPQSEKYGHRDHEVCAVGVSNVAIRKQITLWYSAPPVFMRGFLPNLFVDISSVIQTKIAAIQCYESETNKSFMKLESIINLSRFWAREVGHFEGGYFEAFQIDRQCVAQDFFKTAI
ncbi:putative LmbE-like protein [Synechococcus sp. PCC 7502]|uniref:PIG-L family deacetylase n=1 Tax=Synechococcus sp. PCC 7502 TaxID=1173263 RepID=UPI00029FA1EB|nr:PIG-L family deacetylase [Synechococcus sp. PCC 7502]AFY72473.1 putative LmbE-like protein [Synechococcus sp. PCC 7502]